MNDLVTIEYISDIIIILSHKHYSRIQLRYVFTSLERVVWKFGLVLWLFYAYTGPDEAETSDHGCTHSESLLLLVDLSDN